MASLLDWIDPPTPEITRFYDSEAFKPVKELSEPILVAGDGKSILPADFPNGHYLRNGPNPVFAIGNKLWYHIFDVKYHHSDLHYHPWPSLK